MVNQSRHHLLLDLNANFAISLQMTLHLIPEPEEKASELIRDLTANDKSSDRPTPSHSAVAAAS
jgi:hypothetical protein